MSIFLRRPSNLCRTCYRTFASTALRPAQPRPDFSHPDAISTEVPPYPYGRAQWYKQSDRGLYGDQRIRFGNNVGPKFGVKTRRSWAVNVQRKRLWSNALNRFIQLKVSTRVLRTIDKVGGLDEYLLGDKEARIRQLGMTGWKLRWAIMQTPAIRKRFGAERRSLGLPGIEDEVKAIEAEMEALKIAQQEVEDESDELLEETPQEADPTDPETPNLKRKPVKLRTQPYRHVILTTHGWIRPRQDPKVKFKNELVQARVDEHMAAAEPLLLQRLENLEGPSSNTEKDGALRRTRTLLEKKVLDEWTDIDEAVEKDLAKRTKRRQVQRPTKSTKSTRVGPTNVKTPGGVGEVA